MAEAPPTLGAPGSSDEPFIAALRRSKAEMWAEDEVAQTGSRHLPEPLDVDVLAGADEDLQAFAASATVEGPSIETFSVEGDTCTALGPPSPLVEAWTPLVEALATQMRQVLNESGVTTIWPAYVTASLTPTDQVIGTPHFDDDQFDPSAGVGLAAVVSPPGGTRIATAPIRLGVPRPGLPAAVPVEAADALAAGTLPHHRADPHRVVIFPQFAQLHAGPHLADDVAGLRSMLVYRVGTTPG